LSFLVEIPLEAYRTDAFARFAPSDTFHLGTARAMMWLAQLAYEVRDARGKVAPVLRRWGLQCCALISREDLVAWPLASTHGIVARNRDATFIAFAGTDPLALGNWVTNFTLGSRSSDMHQGFSAALDVVFDELRIALQAADPHAPLYIGGHSLGGALAVTAADRLLRDMSMMAAGIYTFGAPRVGSEAFAQGYNAGGLGARTYRLVHGLDIIPTVPPARLGFRHAGHMITCARGAHFLATPELSAIDCNDPPFADTVRSGYRQRWKDLLRREFLTTSQTGWLGWYLRYVLEPNFVDHLPEHYRRAFEQPDAGE
jgi:hypothetical protein